MNRIKLLFALAAILTATAAFSQPSDPPTPVINVSQFVTADDQQVAVLVKYYPGISTNTSATMQVAQGAALTFQVAGAAYTGFECPVSGALGGIIDTSNAACNTLGEVVDSINGTAENFATGFFRAVIVDGLRSDSSAVLLTAGATQVTRSDGLPMYADTSASYATGETRALLPGDCRTNIACFVTPQGKLLSNPYFGQQTMVNWVEGYSTYGSGTSVLNILSVKALNKAGATGSETSTTLWSEAMGNSQTNKQFTQFQYTPVYGRPNEKVLVRVVNSAAQASVVLSVQARQLK